MQIFSPQVFLHKKDPKPIKSESCFASTYPTLHIQSDLVFVNLRGNKKKFIKSKIHRIDNEFNGIPIIWEIIIDS